MQRRLHQLLARGFPLTRSGAISGFAALSNLLVKDEEYFHQEGWLETSERFRIDSAAEVAYWNEPLNSL